MASLRRLLRNWLGITRITYDITDLKRKNQSDWEYWAERHKEIAMAIGLPSLADSDKTVGLQKALNGLYLCQEALRKYLGLKFTEEQVPDPQYLEPPPKMMTIIKATKVKKESKQSNGKD